jgi:hypothetical protein
MLATHKFAAMRKFLVFVFLALVIFGANADTREFDEWKAGQEGYRLVAINKSENRDSYSLKYSCSRSMSGCRYVIEGSIKCEKGVTYQAFFRAEKTSVDNVRWQCGIASGGNYLALTDKDFLTSIVENSNHVIISMPDISLTLVFDTVGFSNALEYIGGLPKSISASTTRVDNSVESDVPEKKVSSFCVEYAKSLRERAAMHREQFDSKKLARERLYATLSGAGNQSGIGGMARGMNAASNNIRIQQEAAKHASLETLMNMKLKYTQMCN